MLVANYKEKNWRNISLKPGELITSLSNLSKDSGLSISKIRTSLKKLEDSKAIALSSTSQYTKISILYWEKYQGDDKQVANESQTNDKQIATTKERKESKNEKKGKKRIYGSYKNIFLSDEELEKLKQQFSDYEKRIDRLSVYIESTGRVYKNHYATICSWAVKEQKERPKNPYLELLERSQTDIKTDSTAFGSDFTVLP